MKNIKQLVNERRVLVLIIILMAGYIALSSTTLDAARNSGPGQLSVVLSPAHPDGIGTEMLTITLDVGGTLDISNWWFYDASGNTHIISTNALAQGESLKLCADETQDPACDSSWGSDMWDDSGDTLTLHNSYGAQVLQLTYGAVTAGDSVRESVEYTDTSKGNGQKIALCHAKKNGSMSQTIVSADSFGAALGRANGHHAHVDDIIPSFYYDTGSGPTLYEGLRWPDTTGTHAGGCN